MNVGCVVGIFRGVIFLKHRRVLFVLLFYTSLSLSLSGGIIIYRCKIFSAVFSLLVVENYCIILCFGVYE